MQSKIIFVLKANGNLEQVITDTDVIYQGQIGTVEYRLEISPDTPDAEAWKPSDVVFLALTRPDGQSSQILMTYKDGGWEKTSNGWESDVDVADPEGSDLLVSFIARRYSSDFTQYSTKTTQQAVVKIMPSQGYTPLNLSQDDADLILATLGDLTNNLADAVTDFNTRIGDISTLTTQDKANLVAAVNEVDLRSKNAMVTAQNAQATASSAKSTAIDAWNRAGILADRVDRKVGELENLTTENKTDAVSAINEVNIKVDSIPDVPTKIRDLEDDTCGNPILRAEVAYMAYGDGDGAIIKDTYSKIADIQNNLTTTYTNRPLAANQGKILRELIADKEFGEVFDTIHAMVVALNAAENDKYRTAFNFYIVQLNVPDFWVTEVMSNKVIYSYTTDDALIEAVQTAPLQIGYYKISILETAKVDLEGYVQETRRIADITLENDITASELKTALEVPELPSGENGQVLAFDDEGNIIAKDLTVSFPEGSEGEMLIYDANGEVVNIKLEDLWTSEGLIYEDISGTELRVTGYNYNPLIRNVYIPDRVDGKWVTEIAPAAFIDLPIKRVRLSGAIKKIGGGASPNKGAFYECDSLEEVIFDEGFGYDNPLTIEGYAFGDCLLKKLDFPQRPVILADYCFSNNEYLQEMHFHSRVSFFSGSMQFAGCTRLKKISIEKYYLGNPDQTVIPETSFTDCPLTDIKVSIDTVDYYKQEWLALADYIDSIATKSYVDDAIDSAGGSATQAIIVADIAERDALEDLQEGAKVYVKDASDDPDVGEGWAEYIVLSEIQTPPNGFTVRHQETDFELVLEPYGTAIPNTITYASEPPVEDGWDVTPGRIEPLCVMYYALESFETGPLIMNKNDFTVAVLYRGEDNEVNPMTAAETSESTPYEIAGFSNPSYNGMYIVGADFETRLAFKLINKQPIDKITQEDINILFKKEL